MPSRSRSPPPRPTPPASATPTPSAPPAATPATRSPSPSTRPPPTTPAPSTAPPSPSATPAPASSPPTRPATTTTPTPPTRTQSFDVSRATQSITFTSTPPASPAFGDTYTVSATGGDSGNPVTFTVDPATTNNACTIDGSTVTVRHAGTCVIAADQAGNDDYTDATTRTQSFDVSRATQSITFTSTPPDSPAFGDTYTVSATGGDSGNPVTFTVDPATTNNACTIDGSTVTVRHAGTCVIAADQAGNDDYTAAATRTQSVTVSKVKQSITFTSKPPASPAFGDTYTVSATGGDSGNPVTFTVDPATTNNACTIDGSTVTVRHAGTCVIAADQAGNDDYTAAATRTQSVTVSKVKQSITFTSKPPASPAFGDTYTATATSTSGLPVTFSVAPSTTNSACSVSGSTVTFLHAGTCVIAADQAGNDDYTAAPRVTQSVIVHKAPQSITFTSTPPSPGFVGTTYDVSATGGDSGSDVVFSSATATVCTVSGSTVTFKAAGSCRIAANQAGDADYEPAPTVTQSMDVKAPAGDLSVTATVSPRPPTNSPNWHQVDVTVHDLIAGATATVTGTSTNHNALIVPEFNCWFQRDGICHVTSPPVNPTVTFFVLLPANASSAQVTFTVASDTSPDPDPSNDSVTVEVHRWDDHGS